MIRGLLGGGIFIQRPGNSTQGVCAAESALPKCGYKKLYGIQCQKVQGWMSSRKIQVDVYSVINLKCRILGNLRVSNLKLDKIVEASINFLNSNKLNIIVNATQTFIRSRCL